MAEYVYNPVQEVEAGQNVLLQDSIPCKVEFNGNIAIPTGGTAGEISLALAIDGEPIQTSRARVTPTVVDAYFNVTSVANITVPTGCCFTISIENTSGVSINVQNANLTVDRTA